MVVRAKKAPKPSSQNGADAEIEGLRVRIEALEQELATLKAQVPQDDVIVLRAITREQAKQEIKALFITGETLYYSDIVHRLSIDLPLVVELCQELIEEGEIDVQSGG